MKMLFVAPSSNLQVASEILRSARGQQISVCDGNVDRNKLEQFLYSEQYDVVHFAGHGGLSVLQLSDGLLEVQDLLIMLERQHALKLVVVMSCQSTRVGTEIHNKRHIPCVMAQMDIGDPASVRFSETFYRAYVTTGDVARSVDVGRATLTKEFPAYADAVVLANGDMVTDDELAEFMAEVRSELSRMGTQLEMVEAAVRDMHTQQGRTLVILVALLLLAQLATPWLSSLF